MKVTVVGTEMVVGKVLVVASLAVQLGRCVGGEKG